LPGGGLDTGFALLDHCVVWFYGLYSIEQTGIEDVAHIVRSDIILRSVIKPGKNMTIRGASKQIIDTLLKWDGMEAHPHRFGGTEFRIGKREIGHIHGDSLVDIPFPKKVRDEIVAVGKAQPHHILPDSGWVSFYLKQDEDVGRAIQLLHRSYKLALKQRSKRVIESSDAIDPDE
jgi:hypothetical protein